MTCSVQGCERPVVAKGRCNSHYHQLATAIITPKVLARFWARVEGDTADGCWIWTGATAAGYGQLGVTGKIVYAHRLAWQISNNQPVPDGMQVCHTCDNPRCVNPVHLFLGTVKDNMTDRLAKGRGGWADNGTFLPLQPEHQDEHYVRQFHRHRSKQPARSDR